MSDYREMILDRAYQSYVMGGDSYALNYPSGKKAYEKAAYIDAAEKLQAEGMVEIISRGEKRMRLRLTDKGIDYGNRQTL